MKIHRLKEFSDDATTADFSQNNKLKLLKPVEYPRDMEQKVNKNLGKRIPFDSIFPDVQAIMNENEPDEYQGKTTVDRLKRRVIESPLNFQMLNPLKIVHNKLARMV